MKNRTADIGYTLAAFAVGVLLVWIMVGCAPVPTAPQTLEDRVSAIERQRAYERTCRWVHGNNPVLCQ